MNMRTSSSGPDDETRICSGGVSIAKKFSATRKPGSLRTHILVSECTCYSEAARCTPTLARAATAAGRSPIPGTLRKRADEIRTHQLRRRSGSKQLDPARPCGARLNETPGIIDGDQWISRHAWAPPRTLSPQKPTLLLNDPGV